MTHLPVYALVNHHRSPRLRECDSPAGAENGVGGCATEGLWSSHQELPSQRGPASLEEEISKCHCERKENILCGSSP